MKRAAGLGIYQGRAVGPLAGNLVMVEDDDVRAAPTNACDFPRGVRAAVHRNQKCGRMLLETTVDARCTQPVALLGAEGEEAVCLRAKFCQNALEKRQRGDAVHIVVAIEHDSFPFLDCVANALNGSLHLGEREGIFQPPQARFKKCRGHLALAETVSKKHPREELRNAQLPAQATNGEVVILAGKNPSPLHLQILGVERTIGNCLEVES